MDLVIAIYRATEGFPAKEQFGLTSQMRRAAVSVPSNIAEGQGRSATADYVRFLRIARGSLQEIETQVELSRRLGYLADNKAEELQEKSAEICRILAGLIRSLESRNS